jgi:hypothetical protein
MGEMLVVVGNREILFSVTPEKKFEKLYSRQQGNRTGTPATEIETSFLHSIKKTQGTTQPPILTGDYLPMVRRSGSETNYKRKKLRMCGDTPPLFHMFSWSVIRTKT